MTPEAALALRVRGRVQGVAFRAHTREVARRLGLRGFVRNLPDGSVEALAVGPPEALAELATWCRVGPPAAHVTDLQIDERPVPAPAPATFEILR